MGTGSFPGVKSGWGVTLTHHPLLVPGSWKSRAIPLLALWAIQPVQSLSACTRAHFTLHILITILWCNTVTTLHILASLVISVWWNVSSLQRKRIIWVLYFDSHWGFKCYGMWFCVTVRKAAEILKPTQSFEMPLHRSPSNTVSRAVRPKPTAILPLRPKILHWFYCHYK
jgi:hypothetical protein